MGFFAGFCWLVNGVYIGMGAVEAVGDSREMLRLGTPMWVLGVFGIFGVVGGFWVVACDERAVGVWEGERGGERSRTLAGRQCHGEQGGFGLGGGVGGFGDGGGVVGGGARG